VDVCDETEQMFVNMEELDRISDGMEQLAHNLAGYLQAMRINAFCVEWPQAPTDVSFMMAERARALGNRPTTPILASLGGTHEVSSAARDVVEETFQTNSWDPPTPAHPPQESAVKKVTGKKANLTARQRKERDAAVEEVVQRLPIEFRGNDPELRKSAEGVILALMDARKPLRMNDIIKPMLPQAKVNKCLIALVSSKVVTKAQVGGVAHYTFVGVASQR